MTSLRERRETKGSIAAGQRLAIFPISTVAMACAGVLMPGVASARCVNVTAGNVAVAAGAGQPATGNHIVCDASAPNPSTVPIGVGSSSASVTGVTIDIAAGAILETTTSGIVVATINSGPPLVPASLATVTNYGTISNIGSGFGIDASRTLTAIVNGGTIRSASSSGVSNDGELRNLASGTIIGLAGIATSVGSVINEGRVQGTGLRALTAPIGAGVSVLNMGNGVMQGVATVSSGVASVVKFSNSADRFTSAGQSQVIGGAVDGSNGVDTFIFDRSQDSTITHGIANFELLTQTGANRVLLDTDVALIGTGSVTTVEEGTLAVAAARTLTTATAALSAGATLEINGTLTGPASAPTTLNGSAGSETVIANGSLNVSGSLLDGNDTLLLRDNASFVAGSRIDGGAGTDTAVADIASAASFTLPIVGFENFVKQGAGTLTLNGPNTFASTSVNAGRLLVNGSVNGNVVVNNGATLGGSGTLGAGVVTVAAGGRLAPGVGVGTLRVGSLVLDAGAQLDYELGLPNTVGGSQNDLVEVAGNLTLDGTLNLTNMGGMSPGVYRLINYGGTLTDQGLLVGASLPLRFAPSDFLVDTATAGQVNLLAQSGGFALQFWDGSGTVADGVVGGGAATWTNATSNWTRVDGTINAPWQSGFAIFQGTPGTVTLGENIALQGMQFRTGGYTIEGGGFTLAGEPQTIVNVDTRVTATVNAPLVDGAGGPAQLTKNGAGTLVLGGANAYSGGTVVNGGALQVGADNNLGAAAGALALNSALLITTGSFASARAVGIGADGGSVATEGSTTLTLSGPVSGPGTLSKVGTGTLVLSGANSYSGGTFIGNGVLQVGSDANLGATTGRLEFGAGALRLGASFNLDPARPVVLGELGGTIDTQDFTGTIAQAIGGVGGLTKTGSGTLVLAADNGYGGSTTISAGTLQLGNGGSAGSVPGNIANNGALVFNRADSSVVNGVISGTGSVTQAGTGATTFDVPQTYSGTTTVSLGTLRAGGANVFSPASAHSVMAGATLDTAGFDQRVAALTNAGTVNLLSEAPGSTLTVTGPYVGNNGLLRLGATLGGNASASDRLVLDGPGASASGHTRLQVSNLGGLGAQTSGNGIEVVSALNGATTTAQTTKDAFALESSDTAVAAATAGKATPAMKPGAVSAGAYDYRLYAADASGAGENWYLRSETATPIGPVVTYRVEAPAFAALPAQLRQGDLAMLGNLHRRVGDEPGTAAADTPTPASASTDSTVERQPRRAWARAVYTDLDIRQDGVLAPQSDGHLSGLQAGVDLWTLPQWQLGLYLGYLEGGADVSGNARGVVGRVGYNDLQSRYVGGYATWRDTQARYADAVLQWGDHRYGVHPDTAANASGKANSLTASLEVGQSFPLSGTWRIEPQAQLIYQKGDFDDVGIAGAKVSQSPHSGWIGRLGVRAQGDMGTSAGRLQPYGRFNLYYASSGSDVLGFINPAAVTSLASAAGYTTAELAAGATLALSPAVSVYGELGRLFDIGGDARVKSSIQGSLGMKIRW